MPSISLNAVLDSPVSWMGSSSLLLRMRIPQLFASTDGIEINFKADDDTEKGQAKRASGNMNRYKIKVKIKWEQAFAALNKSKEKESIPTAEKLTSITLDGKRITIYTRCIDVRKTYEFKTINNKAGNKKQKTRLIQASAMMRHLKDHERKALFWGWRILNHYVSGIPI